MNFRISGFSKLQGDQTAKRKALTSYYWWMPGQIFLPRLRSTK
jgi:hypothetical protein